MNLKQENEQQRTFKNHNKTTTKPCSNPSPPFGALKANDSARKGFARTPAEPARAHRARQHRDAVPADGASPPLPGARGRLGTTQRSPPGASGLRPAGAAGRARLRGQRQPYLRVVSQARLRRRLRAGREGRREGSRQAGREAGREAVLPSRPGSAAGRARTRGCAAPAPAARGTREQRRFVAAPRDRECTAGAPRGLERVGEPLEPSEGALPGPGAAQDAGPDGSSPRVPARLLGCSAGTSAALGAAHQALVDQLPARPFHACFIVPGSRQTTPDLGFSAAMYSRYLTSAVLKAIFY